MSIPLPLLEGMLKHAREQHPKVVEYMQRYGVLLLQAVRKDPGGDRLHVDKKWFGPGSWRIRIEITDDRIEADALYYWFHSRKGGEKNEALDAILLRGPNRPLHFDSHFFSRWGKRSERMGVLLTNMMGFFRQYPRPPVKHIPTFYPAQPELGAALEQGLIFARHHGNKLISCDTFKNLEMLSVEERVLWERLKG